MADLLRQVGVAVLVLGACAVLVPYLGLSPPGPPNLGFYVAMAGGAMWLLGRILR
jgi:hypothetical protein